MDMSLCGGCVVCLSCYSTLIKILVLFPLVYINSLGVSEHICHRFWRLMISKGEKIPLFIMVSLMCAADKGEISRWCKTSLVISRQHYQICIFFLTAAESLLKFCNVSLDLVDFWSSGFFFFALICFCLYFVWWQECDHSDVNKPKIYQPNRINQPIPRGSTEEKGKNITSLWSNVLWLLNQISASLLLLVLVSCSLGSVLWCWQC